MSTQVTTSTSATTGKMFVRNATGLVRELTPFDAFNLVFAAILIPVGISQALNFGAAAFPGANIALAFVLGGILLLGFGGVYVYFTMAMPRSGGDYVWVSRALHPFLGFVVNVTLTFVFVNWVAFNFTTMMTLFVPAAAYVMGLPAGLSAWFAVASNQFIVATALTLIFTLIMLRGAKFAARFMFFMFWIVWLGMGLWYVGLIITSNGAFNANFTAGTGATPASIINLASSSGFTPSGLNIGMTLLAMLWAFQNLTGFEWTGYFAGEIKNVRRTVVTSVIGGLIVGAVLYALGSVLVYKVVGFNLFSSLSYVGLNLAGKLPAGVNFVLPALTRFLALPAVLKDYIVLAFLLAIIWWTPAGFLLGTRNLFAWSFDRMAPEWVADVHPSLHTPVKATIIIGLYIEFLNWMNIFGGLGGYLINIIAVMALMFIIVGLAAVVFPYRRKDLFDNAPEAVRVKFLGLPLMVWAGIVMMITWAFVMVAAFTASQFGLNVSPLAMIEAFTAPIIAIIWYIIARVIRRNQGIDMDRVFAEIPPE
ncbi:MAG: APC family permease [Chloroflexi bacterium]|nr:APC family permease [Chloroflexota bacterium]